MTLEEEAKKYAESVHNNPAMETFRAYTIKDFIAGATSNFVREEKEKLIKEKDMYKQAYKELVCYFDSISDEEQPKVAKKLEKIFKTML